MLSIGRCLLRRLLFSKVDAHDPRDKKPCLVYGNGMHFQLPPRKHWLWLSTTLASFILLCFVLGLPRATIFAFFLATFFFLVTKPLMLHWRRTTRSKRIAIQCISGSLFVGSLYVVTRFHPNHGMESISSILGIFGVLILLVIFNKKRKDPSMH